MIFRKKQKQSEPKGIPALTLEELRTIVPPRSSPIQAKNVHSDPAPESVLTEAEFEEYRARILADFSLDLLYVQPNTNETDEGRSHVDRCE